MCGLVQIIILFNVLNNQRLFIISISISKNISDYKFLLHQRYKILDKQLDAAIILLIYFRKYFEKKLKELLLLHLKSRMPEKKLETKKRKDRRKINLSELSNKFIFLF